jgi:hypothetical protein
VDERKFNWKEIRLADLLSVGVAGLAIAVSIWTFERQREASDKQVAFERRIADAQAAFEREVEERQSAPLLVPGAELRDRGRRISVYIGSGFLRKRAEQLFVEERPARLVLPVRNVGEGVAILLREYVHPILSCADTASYTAIPPRGLERLGYFAIRPGESDQLTYLAPGPRIGAEYGRASKASELSLPIRYTDSLGRKLRWTCVRYTHRNAQSGWHVASMAYGERRP